jgi:hypothetical protein
MKENYNDANTIIIEEKNKNLITNGNRKSNT